MKAKHRRDIKHKIANPAANFDDATEIVNAADLTKAEKAKALENWEEDARRLSVATEEGMSGGERSHMTDIAQAQAELGLKAKRPATPTKAG